MSSVMDHFRAKVNANEDVYISFEEDKSKKLGYFLIMHLK